MRIFKHNIQGQLQELNIPEYSKSKKYMEIYSSLSKLLGNKTYFFGDKPSTLDAVVIGHLSCHYFASLQDNTLRKNVISFPNLKSYVDRNSKEVFGVELNLKREQKKIKWTQFVSDNIFYLTSLLLGIGVSIVLVYGSVLQGHYYLLG